MPEDLSKNGYDPKWDGDPNEIKSWINYKRERAIEFINKGYSVSWVPDPTNYMSIFTSPKLGKSEYIIGDAVFFPQPSQYGIDEGAVSKLTILKYDGGLESLVLGVRPKAEILFNYDRGHDINRLSQSKSAQNLYDDMISVLNHSE